MEEWLEIGVSTVCDRIIASSYDGSDAEYMLWAEHVMGARCIIYQVREDLVAFAIAGAADRSRHTAVQDATAMQERLEASLKQALNEFRSRLRSWKESGSGPRLVRLCEMLQLSEGEMWALHFVVALNISKSFPPYSKAYQRRGVLQNMALSADISPLEVLNFISPHRQHLIDGLFEIEEDTLGMGISEHSFQMSKPVLLALLGGTPSPEDFITIDNTALSKLLMEEGLRPLGSSQAAAIEQAEEDTNQEEEDEEEEQEEEEEQVDVFALLRELKDTPTIAGQEEASIAAAAAAAEEEEGCLLPYEDDLEYLQDRFIVIAHRTQLYVDRVDDQRFRNEKKSPEQIARELRAKERQALAKCEHRMALTRQQQRQWLPRVERLAEARGLDSFEVWVLLTLVGAVLSPEIRSPGGGGLAVGDILSIHFTDLKQQVLHRKYFYKTSRLVSEHMINVNEGRARLGVSSNDLVHSSVDIDRRMIDYFVALDTELGALVEGSTLITPTVRLDQVIISDTLKESILQSVDNMDRLKQIRKDLGFDDLISYGRGNILLFHGMSGTGKTMLANAIAHRLNKKLLLASLMSSKQMQPDMLRLIFREAKIQDAIVFFDECESLFETRDYRSSSNSSIQSILIEIERYDEMIIMATNRPFDLDEAMHRRISLSVELPIPGAELRKRIWEAHIPAALSLCKDVDIGVISTQFELAGGFIKNAVLGALCTAMRRAGSAEVQLSQSDLLQSCRAQVMGQSQLVGFARRVLPRSSSLVIIDKDVREQVELVVDTWKARSTLVNEWGLSSENGFNQQISVLLIGRVGVGKRAVAEALAFELSKPIRLIHQHEVIQNIRGGRLGSSNPFKDIAHSGAVVAIEAIETLVVSSSAHHRGVDELVCALEHCGDFVVLVCACEQREASAIALNKLMRKMTFVLNMEMPQQHVRAEMWKKFLPETLPISDDVNVHVLASKYELDETAIRTSIQKAATNAFKRAGDAHDAAAVCMADLLQAAHDEHRRVIYAGESIHMYQ